MAWTAPATWVASAVVTAAQLNAQIRDNLLESEVAKATATNQMIVSSGADTVAARVPTDAVVETSEGTGSTTYADLATVGPQVASLTTGTRALVFINAQLTNNTAGQFTVASFAVSGATTIAADDDYAISWQDIGSGIFVRTGVAALVTLTAGSNTFTMKYRVAGGTGTFARRRMQVFPL